MTNTSLPKNAINQTFPVEIRVIYDATLYALETRIGGKHFKTVSGNFLPNDITLDGGFSKLQENVSDSFEHLRNCLNKPIENFTLGVSYQYVYDVRAHEFTLSQNR